MKTRMIGYVAAAAAIAWVAAPATVSSQNGRSSTPAASLQMIDDLVAGNRILDHEGVLDGLGHISVRHRPDRFLLARDVSPGLVTAQDLIEYDLEGAPVNAQSPQGYQERFIHSTIYKARPDVMSIVHAHTASVLAYAVSNIPLRPIFHMAPFLAAGVPTYEIRKVAGSTGMLVNNTQLGDALAQTLGDKTVALMRGHGFVLVAPNIPEAVARSIYLDINARVQTTAMSLGGTVTFLGPQDILPIAPTPLQQPPQPGGYSRSWYYWKARAMGN